MGNLQPNINTVLLLYIISAVTPDKTTAAISMYALLIASVLLLMADGLKAIFRLLKKRIANEDDVPERYRGKSPADIAKMHQEAEKMIGRQSSEIGKLRRLADRTKIKILD